MILLAFRNIIRNKRRTFITLFLVITGTSLIGFMRFLGAGFNEDTVARVVKMDTGFVEITAYGYEKKPSLSRALEVKPDFFKKLEVPGVLGLSPRIRAGALLNFGSKSRFVSVLAADREAEKKITTLHRVVQEGELPDEPNEAAVGYRLARSLGIKTGDEFFLVTSQFDGSVGAGRMKLVGIFNTTDGRLDSSRVVIGLKGGEELFGTVSEDKKNRYYTSIALAVEGFIESGRVKQTLDAVFPVPHTEEKPEDSDVFDPVVLDWMQLNPGMMELIGIANMKMDVFLAFFVFSISFGVLNTVQMSIQERLRELGILLAIGTSHVDVLKMLLWEVFLLIVPGVTLGMIIASLTGYYYNYHPIQLTGTLAATYETMGLRPEFQPIVQPGELWVTWFSLVVPAFVVSLFAVKRIYKIDPVRLINVL